MEGSPNAPDLGLTICSISGAQFPWNSGWLMWKCANVVPVSRTRFPTPGISAIQGELCTEKPRGLLTKGQGNLSKLRESSLHFEEKWSLSWQTEPVWRRGMGQGWNEPAPRDAGWNNPAPRGDGTAGNTDLGMLCPRKHTALGFGVRDWQFYCCKGDMIRVWKCDLQGGRKTNKTP